MKQFVRRGAIAAFSRIEATTIVVILAVVLILAWPALNNAFAKRDLTRTANNARELYFTAFRMATDGVSKGDAELAWPGDLTATSLSDYCAKLVDRKYLTAADLQRILSGPGANCVVTSGGGSPALLTLSGKSALKVYKVKGSDPSNTIFAASSNYVYDTALNPSAAPFADSGFVVVRKSGDAGVYRKQQATPAGYDNNAAKFQLELGRLPGAADGNVAIGDDGSTLTNP